MRRGLSVAFVALAALAPAVSAPAAEQGTVRGVVVHAEGGDPVAGARVFLAGRSTGDGDEMRRVTTTDRRGRFGFDRLPTGDEWAFAVDAIYDGGRFAGGAIQLPDDTAVPPVIDTTLRVWDTTTDPDSIVVRANRMFVVANDDNSVGVIESVTIANLADEAYIGRGGDDARARPGRTATLGFPLPAVARRQGVTILDSDIDVPALLPTEYGFATTVAIPPGRPLRFTFSYGVPGSGGTFQLTRQVLYPTLETEVYAADPLTIASNRVVEAGEQDIEGTTYARFRTGDDLSPGTPLQLVATATATFSPGLVAGIVALGLGLLGGIVIAVRIRSRRNRAPRAEPERGDARPEPDLLRAIAELDLRYKAGEISATEWSARRAELKAGLDSDSVKA